MYRTRVYIEDTDCNGIVYHANYLKFFERARTELFRARGISLLKLRQDEGINFAVNHLEISYSKPLYLDDDIFISSTILKSSPVRIIFDQILRCENRQQTCAQARISVAVINLDGSINRHRKSLLLR